MGELRNLREKSEKERKGERRERRHPCQGLQELPPSQSVLLSAPKENLPAASEAVWGSTDHSVPYVLLQLLLTPASGLI